MKKKQKQIFYLKFEDKLSHLFTITQIALLLDKKNKV